MIYLIFGLVSMAYIYDRIRMRRMLNRQARIHKIIQHRYFNNRLNHEKILHDYFEQERKLNKCL